MEIFEVIAKIREDLLELKLEQARLQSSCSLLERFTWNLLRDLREAVASGDVTITFDEDGPSTVDSPERTDDDPTLF